MLAIMRYTIVAVLTVLGNSLVMAEDDTCSTRYGFDIDLSGLSCADIYYKNPESHGRSGYYVIKTDHLHFVYCDMELECGGTKGGWMRIANIDTRRGDQCPSGWVKIILVKQTIMLPVVTLLSLVHHSLQVTVKCVER